MTDEDALVEELARALLRERHPCWSIVAEIFDKDGPHYNHDGQADEMRYIARAILPIINARLDAVAKERDAEISEDAPDEITRLKASISAGEQEITRQEDLVRAYRTAQLTAEEKLCRMTASEQGWRRRCAHLENHINTLTKERDALLAVAREAEVLFRFYEQSHLAKKTQDGDEKAYRNKQMADKIAQALGGNHEG